VLKSISCRGTQVSWKSGSKKVLRTGNKTWLIRKRGNKLNLNLNINKLKNLNSRPLQGSMMQGKKLRMVLMLSRKHWLIMVLILRLMRNTLLMLLKLIRK
jgi:hypothetical protein